MKNVKLLAGILAIFSISFGCRQAPDDHSTASSQNIDYSIAEPEEVGMNAEIIDELVDSIRSGFYPNRHSLLIFKNNNLVLFCKNF